jgi:hypothetical protein
VFDQSIVYGMDIATTPIVERSINKTLSLGKTDYGQSHKRKIYPTELELELRFKKSTFPHRTIDGKNAPIIVEVSICGAVWNSQRTDGYSFGQNIGTIVQLVPTATVKRIAALWKRWHSNGMKAGTRGQHAALDAYKSEVEAFSYDFDECCNVLAERGLQPDNGYSYGSAWLCEPVPVEVVAELCELFRVPAEQRVEIIALAQQALDAVTATPAV